VAADQRPSRSKDPLINYYRGDASTAQLLHENDLLRGHCAL